MSEGYRNVNRANWDERAPAHAATLDDTLEKFRADSGHVSDIVRFTHEWNHGLGEIVTALLDADMAITGVVEHDSVPYEALPGQMERIGGGEWRLKDRPERLPHTYTLQATKSV